MERGRRPGQCWSASGEPVRREQSSSGGRPQDSPPALGSTFFSTHLEGEDFPRVPVVDKTVLHPRAHQLRAALALLRRPALDQAALRLLQAQPVVEERCEAQRGVSGRKSFGLRASHQAGEESRADHPASSGGGAARLIPAGQQLRGRSSSSLASRSRRRARSNPHTSSATSERAASPTPARPREEHSSEAAAEGKVGAVSHRQTDGDGRARRACGTGWCKAQVRASPPEGDAQPRPLDEDPLHEQAFGLLQNVLRARKRPARAARRTQSASPAGSSGLSWSQRGERSRMRWPVCAIPFHPRTSSGSSAAWSLFQSLVCDTRNTSRAAKKQ